MAEARAWVWFEDSFDVQHLSTPPDDIQMQWEAETVCGLEGQCRRVTFENVDRGKACDRCTAAPYELAGDSRGLP